MGDDILSTETLVAEPPAALMVADARLLGVVLNGVPQATILE